MSRIWAVARHMAAESIRSKIALPFIVGLVILLAVLPFKAVGDGLTLKSRVQTYLSWSLGAVGFALSVLTVLLACNALASEIREKHVLMIVSKPIPRWQFFAGKWLGICMLNAAALAVTALAVLAATWYLKGQDTFFEDRQALEHEVLKVRHGLQPEEPDWSPRVENEIRQLRESGKWGPIEPGAEADRRREIRDEQKRQWRMLVPGEHETFVFRGLLVDRESDDYVHLRIKPTHTAGVEDVPFKALIVCGDPDDPNTWAKPIRRESPVERFDEVPIPTFAVNKDGTLYVRIQNLSYTDKMILKEDDSLELLCGISTFSANVIAALAIIWCRLAFLAALGLLASSFLSFPVGCLACLMVWAVASAPRWLLDAIKWVEPTGEGDPFWILGPVVRATTRAFVWLVPEFTKFDAVGNVIGGRLVPLMWVLTSLTVLVLVKGLILGVVGCIVFTKRELAQVVV